MRRIFVPAVLCGLLAAACGDDSGTGGAGGTGGSGGSTTTGQTTTTGMMTTSSSTTATTTTTTTTTGMEVCGDGMVGPNEGCDDGGTADGDGCDADCAVETGYECDGEPSMCTTTCGDGVAAAVEACDDGNVDNLDGCSSMCEVESGWDCTGTMPSTCSTLCGDGLIGQGGEACDDNNVDNGDGCADDCTIEGGWSCMGEPSTCETSCGDGVTAGIETCDDANMTDADGCTACQTDLGYTCTGSPSVCALAGTCADPIVATNGFVFQWDDLNDFGDDLDNEDASCAQPNGTGSHPDVVFQVDLLAGQRLHIVESGALDVLFHVLDGACASASLCLGSFDGTNSAEVDPGFVYTATAAGTYFVVIDSWSNNPVTADIDLLFEISTCGDGVVAPFEGCDDGNMATGDGCSDICSVEVGYECAGEPSVCTQLPGQDCTDAIVASDGFTYTGSNIAAYGDDLDFDDASCTDVGGTTYDSPEIVFSIDLVAGERLKVTEHGSLDVVMHVLPGACVNDSTCAASAGTSEDTIGVQYVAPADGTYFVVVESFSATPSAGSSFDVRFNVASCGDGVVEAPEFCDDNNATPGDGCSATCGIEPGFVCNGTPSVCTPAPGMTCASPLVVNSNPFQYSASQIAPFGNDENHNPGTGCSDVAASGGSEMFFQVALVAGETVRLRELNPNFDGMYHILSAGLCAGGSACVASSDSSEASGLTYTAAAAGTYTLVVENWGSSSATVPFDVVIDRWLCGDAVVSGNEGCDDGGTMGGDGCSATCVPEAGFACNGSPSTCFDVTACTDALRYLGPCAGTVVTASPAGLPAAIPDGGAPALQVPISVGATGTIQRMVVSFSATHTWDSDLAFSLAGPGGTPPGLDLASGNGSSGDNFTNTFLRDGVATAITSGSAPFTGVYRPEAPLSIFAGQPVNGTWTLSVDDTATGDVGTLTAAELTFCVTP